MILSNLHTHSTYCDGKNPPEEMIKVAVSKGFSSLGFSGHAYTPHDMSYCMTPEKTLKYIDEINFLKEKYKDKIEIYLGCECDLYSEIEREKYDYIIGSIHYIKTGDSYLPVDHTETITDNNVKEFFGGNYKKYTENYFNEVCKLNSIRPDIIGHFDLVTKFNEGMKHFDENEKAYLDAAFSAIDTLNCDIFELNSGAIARGYRSTPYPSVPILKRLKEKGKFINISSDCHQAQYLDCHFNESIAVLKEIGFKSAVILKNKKFTEQPL